MQVGDALTRIVIPELDVNVVVVEGTTASALRAGAGHYPDTPLPCEIGNVAIAGHRTTYGRPFHNVDLLEVGDKITLETPIGKCTYEVSQEPFTVGPRDISVVANTPNTATLTLTTCHPKGSAKQRLDHQGRHLEHRRAELVVVRRLLAGAAVGLGLLLTAPRPRPTAPQWDGSRVTTPAAAGSGSSAITAQFVRARRASPVRTLTVRPRFKTWRDHPERAGFGLRRASANELEHGVRSATPGTSTGVSTSAAAVTPCNGTYTFEVTATLTRTLSAARREDAPRAPSTWPSHRRPTSPA